MEKEKVVPIKRSRKKDKLNKKKIIICLLIFAVICAGVAIGVHYATRLTNDSYKNCALGDVNGDGYINSLDALNIIEYTVKENDLFPNQLLHADVNDDKKVDSNDTLVLLRYIVGDVSVLPYNGSQQDTSDSGGKRVVSSGNIGTSTVQIVNQWENSDGTKSYQLNITVQNKGSSKVGNWKSVIKLSSGATITKSWDCSGNISGSQLTVSGDEILAKSTATCGVILSSADEITITSIETE